MAASAVLTYINEGESARLSCTPAYTVCNRWYDSNERVYNLSEISVTQFQAYQTEWKEKPPAGSVLIIKAKRLGVAAYTGGKTLYYAAPQNGTAYHFIPVDELDNTNTVVLHLSPYRHKTGSLAGDVRLCGKNEYLLCLLEKNKTAIAAVLLTANACVVSLGIALHKLFCKKKSGFGDLYLTVFLLLMTVALLFSSDLGAFLVGSPPYVLLMRSLALLLSPVPLGGFIISKYRLHSRKPQPDAIQ